MNIVDTILRHRNYSRFTDFSIRCECGKKLVADIRVSGSLVTPYWAKHLRDVFVDLQESLDGQLQRLSITATPFQAAPVEVSAPHPALSSLSKCAKCAKPNHPFVSCKFANKVRLILGADGVKK